MNVAALTINVRVLVGERAVAHWRLKTLGIVARILRVPVEVAVRSRIDAPPMEHFREDRQLTRHDLPPVYPDDEDS